MILICYFASFFSFAAGPPSPPTITNIEVNYNALKVTWKTPSSKQDTPITGQVIRIKKTRERLKRRKIDEFMFQAKSNYFILRNLTKGTQYSIWLYATNVAGRSNASKEKQVKTLTEGKLVTVPLCPSSFRLFNCLTLLFNKFVTSFERTLKQRLLELVRPAQRKQNN